MSVLINASTSSGIGLTSDNSGVIQFQSNGANTTSIAANGTLTSSNLTTTGLVTAGNVTLSAGGLITFPDATTQSTAATGSFTSLGSISTASGTSASLGNLTLTSYKQVVLVFDGISFQDSNRHLLVGTSTADDVQVTPNNLATLDVYEGIMVVDLGTSVFTSSVSEVASSGIVSKVGSVYAGRCNISTSSTTISIACSSGNMDAGSVIVYGVK